MMKCLIVDDDENCRKVLKRMLNLYCESVIICGEAANIFEAKDLLAELPVDIVFLDVEMPGGSGFDLLASMEEPNFHVVFTTAHATYALKAIKYAALDYLLKPIDLEELVAAVNRYEEANESKKQFHQQLELLRNSQVENGFHFSKIVLPTDEGIKFFDVREITQCVSMNDQTEFFFKQHESICINEELTEYAHLLEESGFLRLSMGRLVNRWFVDSFQEEEKTLLLKDGTIIQVPKQRVTQIKNSLKGQRPLGNNLSGPKSRMVY